MGDDPHYKTGVEEPLGGVLGDERLFDVGFINAVTREGSGRLVPPFVDESGFEWPYINSQLKPSLYPVTASGEQAIPFGTGAIARDNPNPILATAYQMRSTVFIEAISHWLGGGYVKIHDKGVAVQPNQIDVYVGELYVEESREYVDFVRDSAVWVFEG
jgi:3D (Asp-Asp-Asp) domain-containing protein